VVRREPGVFTPRMVMQLCSETITHADALGLQDVLDSLGDLGGKLLLDLQPPRKAMDHPRQLRNPDHPVVRQVSHVRLPEKGQHVVLAEAHHPDVAQQHQLVVAADLFERPLQIFPGIGLVAGEQLTIRLHHAARRIEQALAVRVVARPFDERADGGQRLVFRHGLAGLIGHAPSASISLNDWVAAKVQRRVTGRLRMGRFRALPHPLHPV
jgi:hypothetical protein